MAWITVKINTENINMAFDKYGNEIKRYGNESKKEWWVYLFSQIINGLLGL